MAEVVTYSLSRTCFIWLPSLNFDSVLSSPSENRPQLTTQSLLLVKPVFAECCFALSSKLQSYCSRNTMFIYICLNYARYEPMVSMSFNFRQCNVSASKVSFSSFASFSLLQYLQELFASPRPKFIGYMLKSSPTFLTVNMS